MALVQLVTAWYARHLAKRRARAAARAEGVVEDEALRRDGAWASSDEGQQQEAAALATETAAEDAEADARADAAGGEFARNEEKARGARGGAGAPARGGAPALDDDDDEYEDAETESDDDDYGDLGPFEPPLPWPPEQTRETVDKEDGYPLICGYLQRRTPRGTWVLRWWALERKSYVDRLCIYHDHAGYLKGERLTALTMKRVVSVAKLSFHEPAHTHGRRRRRERKHGYHWLSPSVFVIKLAFGERALHASAVHGSAASEEIEYELLAHSRLEASAWVRVLSHRNDAQDYGPIVGTVTSTLYAGAHELYDLVTGDPGEYRIAAGDKHYDRSAGGGADGGAGGAPVTPGAAPPP